MKIIHILCGKANPKTTMNGVNVCVDMYARLMHERGIDVEVWGIASNPHTNLPSPEYPIRFFQHYHNWPRKLDPELVEAAKGIVPESTVLHFHSGFMPEFPKIVKLAGRPRYFVMPHHVYGDPSLSRRWWRKWLYFALVEGRFLSETRGLLLFSERELGKRIARSLRKVSHCVISKGARLGSARPEPRGHGTTADPVVWGFCGRIHEADKGIGRLLRSFVRFREQRTDENHILLLVGDGPDLPRMREVFAAEIEAGVVETHGYTESTPAQKHKQQNYRYNFHGFSY